MRLLADVRQVFADADRLSTRVLLDGLNEFDESPWGGWDDRKGLTPRSLAGLLRRYGIRSRSVRFDDETTAKGYHADQFEDAWRRYLPQERPPKRHNVTTRMAPGIAAISETSQDALVTDSEVLANPHGDWVVPGVPDAAPE